MQCAGFGREAFAVKRIIVFAVLALVIGCGSSYFGLTDGPELTVKGSWIQGGALYDKWWTVANVEPPKDDHPLWATRPDQQTNGRKGATTWRCKECHGWDYKGVDGAYGGGSHRTGVGGILKASKLPSEKIFDIIAVKHGYLKSGMREKYLWDLVAFVRHGLIDTAGYLDADKRFKGRVEEGKKHYTKGTLTEAGCAKCHGSDGLKEVVPGFDEFPPKMARKNPWELMHKIRFGHPGSTMPNYGLQIRFQNLKDLGAYIQSLPVKAN
jgi:thiosulfate dehydrogenase